LRTLYDLIGRAADFRLGQFGPVLRCHHMQHGIDLAAREQVATERCQRSAGRGAKTNCLIARPDTVEGFDRAIDGIDRAGLARRKGCGPTNMQAGADSENLFHQRRFNRHLGVRPDLAKGGQRHVDALGARHAGANAAARAQAVAHHAVKIRQFHAEMKTPPAAWRGVIARNAPDIKDASARWAAS